MHSAPGAEPEHPPERPQTAAATAAGAPAPAPTPIPVADSLPYPIARFPILPLAAGATAGPREPTPVGPSSSGCMRTTIPAPVSPSSTPGPTMQCPATPRIIAPQSRLEAVPVGCFSRGNMWDTIPDSNTIMAFVPVNEPSHVLTNFPNDTAPVVSSDDIVRREMQEMPQGLNDVKFKRRYSVDKHFFRFFVQWLQDTITPVPEDGPRIYTMAAVFLWAARNTSTEKICKQFNLRENRVAEYIDLVRIHLVKHKPTLIKYIEEAYPRDLEAVKQGTNGMTFKTRKVYLVMAERRYRIPKVKRYEAARNNQPSDEERSVGNQVLILGQDKRVIDCFTGIGMALHATFRKYEGFNEWKKLIPPQLSLISDVGYPSRSYILTQTATSDPEAETSVKDIFSRYVGPARALMEELRQEYPILSGTNQTYTVINEFFEAIVVLHNLKLEYLRAKSSTPMGTSGCDSSAPAVL